MDNLLLQVIIFFLVVLGCLFLFDIFTRKSLVFPSETNQKQNVYDDQRQFYLFALFLIVILNIISFFYLYLTDQVVYDQFFKYVMIGGELLSLLVILKIKNRIYG